MPPSTPGHHPCAVPLIKRTPSRVTLSNTLSARKRRRVSIASFDLAAELGVQTTQEPAVEETEVSHACHVLSASAELFVTLSFRQTDLLPSVPLLPYPFTPPLAPTELPSHLGFSMTVS